jgi:predicted dehydrogenase
MFEQAIHMVDLACHFLGEPVSVNGHLANLGHRQEPDYTGDDTGLAMIRFAGGAMATVSSSNCAVPGRFAGDFRIVATGGVLDYRSSGDWRQKDTATIHHGGAEEHITEENNPYQDQMRDFLAAVTAGRPSPVPIRAGLQSLRIALAVAGSSRSQGAPVFLT